MESKWPAYVSVSEWFFKPSDQPKQSQENHTSSASTIVAVDGAVTDVIGDDASMVEDAGEEGDDTLIVSDHSQGPCGN